MKALRKSGLIFIFLLLILGPYVLAFAAGGQDYVFKGFLLNPADGNSYLAKMYQGWAGSWIFYLPFTAEPGNGAYLFLFYLFLGHLARWTGLSLLLTFHLARMLGGLFLLFCLYRFLGILFVRPDSRKWAFTLAVFGSGLGWMVFPFGTMTSDFWVAEAFPFLSSFINPHFPFSLGLILIFLTTVDGPQTILTAIRDVGLVLALAILQPFGVVILALIWGGKLAWDWFETRKFPLWRLVWITIGGGPMLFYQFWVVRIDPALANWNAQNLTPSPPAWDVLVSFSPVILLAVLGGVVVVRHRLQPGRLVLVWAVLGLCLLVVPFNLQRRFMLGLYIPLVVLSIYALEYLQSIYPRHSGWLRGLVLGLALPTNLVLMLVACFGILGRLPPYYLKSNEVQALRWLRANTPEHALILAPPDMGQVIPGWTGRRVIYGHPYETVDAAVEKKIVQDYFDGKMSQLEADQFYEARKINYIFLDQTGRMVRLVEPASGSSAVVYSNQDVTIYQVGKEP